MVGSKQAFEVSLPDVAQTQMQGKTDVLLEFHHDDTTGANEVCSSCSGSTHIAKLSSNTRLVLLLLSFLLLLVYIVKYCAKNVNPSWL